MRTVLIYIALFSLLGPARTAAQLPTIGRFVPSGYIPGMLDTTGTQAYFQFEQGEFYHKYHLKYGGTYRLPLGWATSDSLSFLVSPDVRKAVYTGNADAVVNLYRKMARSFFMGFSLSHFSTGTYNDEPGIGTWDIESDRQQVSVKGEYNPLPYAWLSLNTGFQTNGNRARGLSERDHGFFYLFKGTADSLAGLFRRYRLSVLDMQSFVPRNNAVYRVYQLYGTNRISETDSLVAAAGYTFTGNRSFFYSKTDLSNKMFALSLRNRFFEYLDNNTVFEMQQAVLEYPGNAVDNKKETVLIGGVAPRLAYKRLSLDFNALVINKTTDFAYEHSQRQDPAPHELPAAARQLMNEIKNEIQVNWKAAYVYFRSFEAGFARLQNIQTYDYPYSYYDGTLDKITNRDARDVLYDNDTIFVVFPALDTGKISLSRASRHENYLDARRSAVNHRATTYRIELTHIFASKRLLYSRNALALSVNEDSLVYTQNEGAPHGFYRRREYYTFNDVNALPGFRRPEDSVIVRYAYGIEEDGSMYYRDDSRVFIKKTVYSEWGAGLQLHKRVLAGLSAGAGFNVSKSTTFDLDPGNPAAGYSWGEKLWRGLFSVDDEFRRGAVSFNRRIFLSAHYRWKNLRLNLRIRDIRATFNRSATNDYLYIDTNLTWTL